MCEVTLDAKIGLAVSPNDYFNEVRSIQTLSLGLRCIAEQLKVRERAWEAQTKGKVNLVSFGLDIDGQPGSPYLDIVACLFHWFGVSLYNMARLVGFVNGLQRGDFSRCDLADAAKFKHIKDSVDSYVKRVDELSAVLQWRHKVGAHFAITSPRWDDNTATLDMSVMHPVTFARGRYRVSDFRFTRSGPSTGTQTSGIPSWSVTEVFESLIPRYWPGIQVADAEDRVARQVSSNHNQRRCTGMGITYIDGVVTGPSGEQATLSFLVDSGATYTLLPEKDWRAMGLSAKRRVAFTLADGTRVERDVSECHLALPQGEGHTPVILGQEDDQALLGMVTLEILGLVLNPFNRTLQPMRMLLA